MARNRTPLQPSAARLKMRRRSPRTIHQEQQNYLQADPTERLHVIEKAFPPELRGVFQVGDKLIARLAGPKLSGLNPWEDRTTTSDQRPSQLPRQKRR